MLRSPATTQAYCSSLVLPRNCKVMCHPAAADHLSPSPGDRSRSIRAASSPITVSGSGIPINSRIACHFVLCFKLHCFTVSLSLLPGQLLQQRIEVLQARVFDNPPPPPVVV